MANMVNATFLQLFTPPVLWYVCTIFAPCLLLSIYNTYIISRLLCDSFLRTKFVQIHFFVQCLSVVWHFVKWSFHCTLFQRGYVTWILLFWLNYVLKSALLAVPLTLNKMLLQSYEEDIKQSVYFFFCWFNDHTAVQQVHNRSITTPVVQ